MEYRVLDNSGTDDDLPHPPYQNRVPRGTRAAGVGRALIGSVSYSRMQSEMETQIHNLEKEAYSSVLRAFKAQADAITWEKEGLITELRKELRVSDDEHRELLSQVNADDVIHNIREWRQAGGHENTLLSTSQVVHDPIYGSTVSASRKKPKTSHSVPSLLPGVPSSALCHQSAAASSQPPFSAGIRGAASRARGRPKGYQSRLIVRGQSFSHGSSGALVANESFEAAASDPLIGRKVMTRWPEDKYFYEAVIGDYNPLEGRHALVYDKSTPNETWEWVNLKEIPPEDIRWEGENPTLSHSGGHGTYSGGHGGQGRGLKKSLNSGGSVSGAGIGRGSLKCLSKSELPPSQKRIVEKVPDEVEIFHTETLLKEVEKVLDHPDRTEIEKAKSMLKEHEQALVDLIARLAYASDGESEREQPLSNQQSMDREHGGKSSHHRGEHHSTGFGVEMAGKDVNHGEGDRLASDNRHDDDIDI